MMNDELATSAEEADYTTAPLIFPFPDLPEGYLDKDLFDSLQLGFATSTPILIYAEGDEVGEGEGLPVENLPLRYIQEGDYAVSGTRFAPAPITEVRTNDSAMTMLLTAESMNGDGRTLSIVAGTDQPILCADASDDNGLRLFWCPTAGITDDMRVITNLQVHPNAEDPSQPPHIHLDTFKVVSNYHNGRVYTIETCVKGEEQTMMVGDIITASL